MRTSPDVQYHFQLAREYHPEDYPIEECRPRRWYVRGPKGAVQLTLARVSPDLEKRMKKRVPNSRLFSVDAEGHLWMGLDIGYHLAVERGRRCQLIDNCDYCRFTIGSHADAQAICQAWLDTNFDDGVIYRILTDEYEEMG